MVLQSAIAKHKKRVKFEQDPVSSVKTYLVSSFVSSPPSQFQTQSSSLPSTIVITYAIISIAVVIIIAYKKI